MYKRQVQASSDLLTAQDRRHLQVTADQLLNEVSSVMQRATFKDQAIFDGRFQVDSHLSTTGAAVNVPGLNFDDLFTYEHQDHDIVFIIDSSKSTSPELSDILAEIQSFIADIQAQGPDRGSISIGLIHTGIKLNGNQGVQELQAHELVSLNEESEEDDVQSLIDFMKGLTPKKGYIDFKSSIEYATDEFEWREDAYHSLVLVGSNGGEGNHNGMENAVTDFMNESPYNSVSAIGIPENQHPDSLFFRDQIVPIGQGVYQSYTDQFDLDSFITSGQNGGQITSGLDLSTTHKAQEAQYLSLIHI